MRSSITSLGQRHRRAFTCLAPIAASAAALLLPPLAQTGRAGSATWSASPASSDWLNANNWSPNTVPNGSNDVASFGLSTQTTVNNSSNSVFVSLNGITFNAVASAYTLTGVPGAAYLIR